MNMLAKSLLLTAGLMMALCIMHAYKVIFVNQAPSFLLNSEVLKHVNNYVKNNSLDEKGKIFLAYSYLDSLNNNCMYVNYSKSREFLLEKKPSFILELGKKNYLFIYDGLECFKINSNFDDVVYKAALLSCTEEYWKGRVVNSENISINFINNKIIVRKNVSYCPYQNRQMLKPSQEVLNSMMKIK